MHCELNPKKFATDFAALCETHGVTCFGGKTCNVSVYGEVIITDFSFVMNDKDKTATIEFYDPYDDAKYIYVLINKE